MNNRMEKACYNILLNSGTVPKQDLDRLWREAETSQSSFSQLLIQSKAIKEPDLLQIYSKNLGLPYVHLKSIEVNKAVFEKVPVKFTSYYRFFPIKLTGQKLTIAVSRLLDPEVIDEIKFGIGYDIEIAFAPERDIEEMLKQRYGLGAATVERILTQSGSGEGAEALSTAGSAPEVEDIEKLAETASVGQLVNQIILDAYKRRASDIHIEPYRGNVRVRYRVDGKLLEAKVSPEMKKFLMPILSRVKIMANLNIVERRLPQDGKARVKTQGESIDLRISSIPTPHGESMVIRILPSQMIFSLDRLGFDPHHQKVFEQLIKRPHGVIFVTGPTGSGKSTTLYAGLNTINTVERKVITIEDPIEYELPGMTQIQVMPEIGLTFAQGLRSMLRHDPDVMMVGEVRDLETADIAIRAALTGHLILSTLHTNDAASGITRLLDIGVEPYLVSSSVIAFIAQRLVRVICDHCKEECREALPEIKKLIRHDLKLPPERDFPLYRGKGCDDCHGTGFSGRSAIHEILTVDDSIRRMITSRSSAEEIRARACSLGMTTLRQNGWGLVLKGLTIPDEIMEVTPEEDVREAGQDFPQPFPEETAEFHAEHRVFERTPVKTRIAYRVIHLDEPERKTGEPEKPWDREGETENLSANGVAFLTADPLQKGDELEFQLELPDKGRPIQCMGRVVRSAWVTETKTPEQQFLYRIAVSFLAINSLDRSRIERFVKGTKAPNEGIV